MFIEKHFRSLVVVIWVIQCVLLLTVTWSAIFDWKMGDPDDQLRLVQVRDWIAGQSWWNLDQSRMNPPFGGPMHWSRLVDIPLAGFILVVAQVTGQPFAEHITVALLPLLTLGIVVYLIALITRELFGAKAALVAAASIILMVPVIIQLAPMRIDHHGWQIVLFLTSVRYLLDYTAPVRSAVIIGLALAVWTEISIEGLPFAIVFMGLLALRWFNDDRGRGTQLAWAMASLAASSAIIFVATERLALATNDCDELSLFHIAAFMAAAAIVVFGTLVDRARPRQWQMGGKLLTLATAGSVALAVVMFVAPQCAGDTFAGLDPLVRQYWYNRTAEGLPLWQQDGEFIVQQLTSILLGIVGVVLFFTSKISVSRNERIIVAILFAGCTIIGLQVARASVYSLCLTVILLAPVATELFIKAESYGNIWYRNAVRILAVGLAMSGVVGANASAFFASFETPPTSAEFGRQERLMNLIRKCQSQKYIAPLDKLPTAQLMAGLDISPAILQFTRHKVVASGHHRNQSAMRDVIRAFVEDPDVARKIYARRNIQFLVTCNGSSELLMYRHHAPNGLWARLANGEQFSWLHREPDIGPYQIWRFENESLKLDRIKS